MLTTAMLERIIVRLEKAGGELTEAASLSAEGGAEYIPLGNALRALNVMIADSRHAVIRIQAGNRDPDTAIRMATNTWIEDIEDINGH